MSSPVSLADLKVHLRLEPDATGDDVYLYGMMEAARRACERYTNRRVEAEQRSFSLDGFPVRDPTHLRSLALGTEIWLPEPNVTSVDSITYVAGGAQTTLAGSAYGVDLVSVPGRVFTTDTWPQADRQPGAVVIGYTVSPLSPDDLAVFGQAMMLLIAGWYRNREASQVDARGAPAEIPLAVSWLLGPLRQLSTR